LPRLKKSKFRMKFRLDDKDIAYIEKIGLSKIEEHAAQFVADRLAPKEPKNDGRQTPFKGHPVFKAQHATATCCRSCLEKWHSIPCGRELSLEERMRIVRLIMGWIKWRVVSPAET